MRKLEKHCSGNPETVKDTLHSVVFNNRMKLIEQSDFKINQTEVSIRSYELLISSKGNYVFLNSTIISYENELMITIVISEGRIGILRQSLGFENRILSQLEDVLEKYTEFESESTEDNLDIIEVVCPLCHYEQELGLEQCPACGLHYDEDTYPDFKL